MILEWTVSVSYAFISARLLTHSQFPVDSTSQDIAQYTETFTVVNAWTKYEDVDVTNNKIAEWTSTQAPPIFVQELEGKLDKIRHFPQQDANVRRLLVFKGSLMSHIDLRTNG